MFTYFKNPIGGFLAALLVILITAITYIKTKKNREDGDTSNDGEIKGYIFDAIDGILSTMKIVEGASREEATSYIVEGVKKKLLWLKDQSGIKIPLSEGAINSIINTILETKFGKELDEYIRQCTPKKEVKDTDVSACDEELIKSNDEDFDIEDVSNEVSDDELDESGEDEEDDSSEIPESDDFVETPSIESMTDTLKDEAGNEVDVPAGNIEDEPAEILPEEEPVEESIPVPVDYESMTKVQLKEIADANGIHVTTKTLKADMIAAIKEKLG